MEESCSLMHDISSPFIRGRSLSAGGPFTRAVVGVLVVAVLSMLTSGLLNGVV